MNRFLFLLAFAPIFAAAIEIPTDSAAAWQLHSTAPRKQTLSTPDYSPAIGKVQEIVMTPGVFSYCELNLRERIRIASGPEELKGSFSLDLFAEPAGAVQAVSIRLIDATGEIFQYRTNVELRPGSWKTVPIPLGKPSAVWGGNKDRKPDFPVDFLAVTVDCRKETPGTVRILIDNLIK